MNEKHFLWIIIIFFVILAVALFFRSCGVYDNSGTDARITGKIQYIAGKISASLELLQGITEIYRELERERDNLRNTVKQLRTAVAGLEQRYNELQSDYRGLREYQSTNNETIRSLEESSNNLGTEFDAIETELDGLDRLIRKIQERAEQTEN